MAEQTENIRKDSNTRDDKQQQKTDWSGRVFVPPNGTTLPPINDGRIDGEVFVKLREGAAHQLYIYNKGIENWVTAGP